MTGHSSVVVMGSEMIKAMNSTSGFKSIYVFFLRSSFQAADFLSSVAIIHTKGSIWCFLYYYDIVRDKDIV